MGGEELKWCQLANHHLMSQQGPYFSSHRKEVKANDKSTNLRKMVSSGINGVDFSSVYSEKTHLKKMIMITIIITSNRKTIY